MQMRFAGVLAQSSKSSAFDFFLYLNIYCTYLLFLLNFKLLFAYFIFLVSEKCLICAANFAK